MRVNCATESVENIRLKNLNNYTILNRNVFEGKSYPFAA
jgi:hypothetical protein